MKAKLLVLVFVLICGTVLTASLIVVDSYTAPIIARNSELQLKSSILTVLCIPFDSDTLEKQFDATVRPTTRENKVMYVARDGSVAFAFEGGGLWGPIIGTIALEPDLRRIKSIRILQQEETPGLGSRIASPSHLQKFVGRPFLPALRSVPAGKGSAPTDIDAITGATLSSNALVEILNKNLSSYEPLLAGVKP